MIGHLLAKDGYLGSKFTVIVDILPTNLNPVLQHSVSSHQYVQLPTG